MLSNRTAKLRGVEQEWIQSVVGVFVMLILCLVTLICWLGICDFVQPFSLLLLHTSEIRLVARPRSKLCGGVKLHFWASSLHINCYILILNTTRGILYTVERTMYSIYMALDTAFPLSTRIQHCQLLCCPTRQVSYLTEAVSDWTIWPWKSGFWLLA